MLKKSAIRRITVATLALIITSILYFFPEKTTSFTIPQNINYVNSEASPIYLLNEDSLVARTTIPLNDKDPIEKAKKLINALIIDNENKEYLPSNFKQIIPKNTKIIEISLDDKLLKINFSKDILNVSLEDEEKLIESLIYTLTEIDGIDAIMIFIEGEKLNVLPQSKINLPHKLDKNFGINKVYDITSLKDISKTTTYYVGKTNDITYYIPITKITNDDKDKIEVIITELKSSPIYKTNLLSYLASSAKLESYEVLEEEVYLSFNNAIFDDLNEKNILEEVKYSIGLSIRDTLNIKDVFFKVNNELITNLNKS